MWGYESIRETEDKLIMELLNSSPSNLSIPENNKKFRCKCCELFCESTKSLHVCEECYTLYRFGEPLKAKPK